MTTDIKEISSSKCFGGYVKRFSHKSLVCNCDMNFYVYIPPQAEKSPVPVSKKK